MDIREALLQIPEHSSEWIDRYITLLAETPEPTGAYDRHHILPRGIFPEFGSFTHNPWNRIHLAPADHLVAHYYLYRAFPNSPQARVAFRLMVGLRYMELVESSFDEVLIAEIATEYEAVRTSGNVPTITGWVRVYRGEEEATAVPQDQLEESLAKGWTQTAPPRQWVHKGEEETRVLLAEVSQYEDRGFVIGRGNFWSEESRAKASDTHKLTHAKRRSVPDAYDTMPRGDNHHRRIYGISDETKAKIAETLTGRTRSPEAIAKTAAAMTGKTWAWSDESRQKKSEAMMGEGNNRYGQPGGMLGKSHTEETKAQMAASHKARAERGEEGYWKGKTGPMAGKTHNEETRKKLAAAMVGKKLSDETREKMRLGHARRKLEKEAAKRAAVEATATLVVAQAIDDTARIVAVAEATAAKLALDKVEEILQPTEDPAV